MAAVSAVILIGQFHRNRGEKVVMSCRLTRRFEARTREFATGSALGAFPLAFLLYRKKKKTVFKNQQFAKLIHNY